MYPAEFGYCRPAGVGEVHAALQRYGGEAKLLAGGSCRGRADADEWPGTSVVMAVIFAGHTGVIHIMIVELFPTRVRYSAYGLGYNVSSALFGGAAPLLMTYLIAQTGSVYVPAIYAVLTALGTLAALHSVTDRAHLPLRDA